MDAELSPFRAVGGNVHLRRVKHDSPLLLLQETDTRVLQVGELVSCGSRWTQDSVWNPPISLQGQKARHLSDQARMLDGSLDPDWKPVHVPERPRVRGPIFTEAHAWLTSEIKPGDLVVYNQARVYETFKYDGQDYLIYPGCWLLGVVKDAHLSMNPHLRRYEEMPV